MVDVHTAVAVDRDGQHVLATLFFKFHVPKRYACLLAQRQRHFLHAADQFLGLHTYLLKNGHKQ